MARLTSLQRSNMAHSHLQFKAQLKKDYLRYIYHGNCIENQKHNQKIMPYKERKEIFDKLSNTYKRVLKNY